MKRYNPKNIEPKWQQKWEESGIYKATEDPTKPKRYVLEYFPYPSGAAMHVGHVRNYTIGDAVARFWRMQGYNVLHPMGWDAFGLPAENFAIKNNISPQQAIKENTTKFKQQLTQMGFSYDWSREINSTDPKYYKWTQWFFKLLFERGLAYQKESLQWWCDTDKTVLANEQVENGKCWRCGNAVVKKPLKQWFFKITDYADRLADDLADLDWSEGIKAMQRNWIGKSKGAEIVFKIADSEKSLKVFTTRPDTLFGATFMVVAPEHPLVATLTGSDQKESVDKYVKETQAKSDIERQETEREKTGVFTGSYAVNPINDQKIPVWIADYVLMGYGTGAIMAVPAHDERDFEFAKKFNLQIVEVYKNDSKSLFGGEGTIINSGIYDGISTSDMREKIVADLAAKGIAEERINYRIRDWLISRQRYWGAPIPIVHCEKDGAVAVPDDQLPVELPEVASYQPTGEGTSVLASVTDWVNTACPKCGGPAKRETDTMDGFACSSWYFLRFADPHNEDEPFAKEKAKFWLPVDDYIGGAEHAVMHLLYARMWTKVMHDAGLIEFDEPFKALRNHGMILAPDGRKMSKSWGNVIAPDDLINQGYGADATRIMELFIGPWNQEAAWSVEGMGGCFRFLNRVWTLTQEFILAKPTGNSENKDLLASTHQVIKKVTVDLRDMGFNTAIAALMEFTNTLYKLKAENEFNDIEGWQFAIHNLAVLLAPFAPHIAEELWAELGNSESVHLANWPEWDEKYLVADTMNIVVQVNGKVRANIKVPANATEDEVVQSAKTNEKVAANLGDNQIKKSIYVPKRLVNFVI
jgi:leucyl-tRNA synthetase